MSYQMNHYFYMRTSLIKTYMYIEITVSACHKKCCSGFSIVLGYFLATALEIKFGDLKSRCSQCYLQVIPGFFKLFLGIKSVRGVCNYNEIPQNHFEIINLHYMALAS